MTRKQKIRLLVKNILSQNTEKADKILKRLISEAEGDREDQALDEAEEQLGISDEDQKELQDNGGSEQGDDEFEALDDDAEDLDDQIQDDEFGPSSEQEQLETDADVNDLVDKQVNFECQINNLVLNDLINKVADLKTSLENNTTLDKHSREFYEIKVPLQYYSETLLKIQKNITPLVNQDEVKKQLDEISISLQELSNKIGEGDEELTSIESPNEVVDRQMNPEFQ